MGCGCGKRKAEAKAGETSANVVFPGTRVALVKGTTEAPASANTDNRAQNPLWVIERALGTAAVFLSGVEEAPINRAKLLGALIHARRLAPVPELKAAIGNALSTLRSGAYPDLGEVMEVFSIMRPMEPVSKPTRPGCLECVEKHIGAAWVLIGEHRDGYPHRVRAVGHLHEAEDESQPWLGLHAAIRDARKEYQSAGTTPDFEALSNLIKATLDADTESS